MGLLSYLVRRFDDVYEDFAFSRDRELVRSLDESDARLRAGEAGTIADLERELAEPRAQAPQPISH